MTRDDFIMKIHDYAGVKEGSTTHQEIVKIYNTITPLPRGYKASITDPWCAIFVSAMWKKHMGNDNFPFECSCTRMINLLKSKNHFYLGKGLKEPEVGWLIFYDWERDGSPDHVGYVVGTDGYITTVEGNRNDCVQACTIAPESTTIYGYGVLKYDDSEVEDAKSFVTRNGIMLGDGTDTYWKNTPTREQLATILYRYHMKT